MKAVDLMLDPGPNFSFDLSPKPPLFIISYLNLGLVPSAAEFGLFSMVSPSDIIPSYFF